MTTKENILTTLTLHKPDFLKFGISAVGIFGSYVRDEQNTKSDIDVLLDFIPEQENYDNYMAAYDLLETLFKNEKVEVVTKNGLSPYIAPAILKEVAYA